MIDKGDWLDIEGVTGNQYRVNLHAISSIRWNTAADGRCEVTFTNGQFRVVTPESADNLSAVTDYRV